MKILACLLSITIGLVATSLSAAATFGPLVSPQELATERDRSNPLILDIRGEAYAKGHIPGSTSAPYGLFRGPKENPGQLLDVATLEERFEALGLDTGRPIVIVPEGKTDTDFGAAARVYWTLKSTGFSDLSILNGGLLAWQAAGLALDTEAFTPQATQLDITFADDWTAGTEQIVAASRGEVDALLLDARPDDFYRGRKSHPAAARPGTIPGAENFAYSGFFEPGS
ncbi:MAG: sulfurtransferase, partial [Granulosicoccus sp.]|nr:sulfurtransferase [Granulosicoccus sp.]